MNINELTIFSKSAGQRSGRPKSIDDNNILISINKNGNNGKVVRVSFSHRMWCMMGKPQKITPAVNTTRDRLYFLLNRNDGYCCVPSGKKDKESSKWFKFDMRWLNACAEDFVGESYLNKDDEGYFFIMAKIGF